MKQSITITLSFILMITSIFSCKKYPEDPFISFRTARDRLTGNEYKSWDLVFATVDGIDSTQQFKNGSICFMEINYDKDKIVTIATCNLRGGNSNGWGFDEDRNLRMQGVLLYPRPMSPHQTTPGVMYVSWLTHYILKLTDKELKFKVVHPQSGKIYIFDWIKSE